jgi:hypothetical protein
MRSDRIAEGTHVVVPGKRQHADGSGEIANKVSGVEAVGLGVLGIFCFYVVLIRIAAVVGAAGRVSPARRSTVPVACDVFAALAPRDLVTAGRAMPDLDRRGVGFYCSSGSVSVVQVSDVALLLGNLAPVPVLRTLLAHAQRSTDLRPRRTSLTRCPHDEPTSARQQVDQLPVCLQRIEGADLRSPRRRCSPWSCPNLLIEVVLTPWW